MMDTDRGYRRVQIGGLYNSGTYQVDYRSGNQDYGNRTGVEMGTDRSTYVNIGIDQGYRGCRSGSGFRSGTGYRSGSYIYVYIHILIA